jgi:hypothetical protein
LTIDEAVQQQQQQQQQQLYCNWLGHSSRHLLGVPPLSGVSLTVILLLLLLLQIQLDHLYTSSTANAAPYTSIDHLVAAAAAACFRALAARNTAA